MNMTKHVATHKNMADGHEQENIEEGATTLGSDARTVRQLTGEATALGSDVRTVRQLTGEAAASGSDVRTVRQPTGETPGTQSIWKVTDTVMEGRRVEETPPSTWEQALQQVEEIPPNTWEQVPRCLSPERCEVIGESNDHAGKAWQQEVAEEPPQDHASDQEETKDEESLSEVN